MKFYHATTEENALKIVLDGKIKKSVEGAVFVCKNPLDACKFLVIRGIEKIIVFEVDLDEKRIVESTDHSEDFFQCKAYMYNGEIEIKNETPKWEYNFPNK